MKIINKKQNITSFCVHSRAIKFAEIRIRNEFFDLYRKYYLHVYVDYRHQRFLAEFNGGIKNDFVRPKSYGLFSFRV